MKKPQQKQFVRGVQYTIIGPSGKSKTVIFAARFRFGRSGQMCWTFTQAKSTRAQKR